MPDRIEQELLLAISGAQLWEFISQAEHLGSWFGDAGAEIDLRPGGKLVLHWHEYGTAHGRIEAVEPLRLLSYRWAPFDDPGGEEPNAGNATLVTFSLSPQDAKTLLRIDETGFENLDCSPAQQQRNLEGNRQGWEIELRDLVDYVTQGSARAAPNPGEPR